MICSGLSGKMLTLTLWKKTCVFVSVSIRIWFVCFFPICVCAHIAFVCVCFVNEKVCVIVSRCPDINGSLRKGHCLHPPCVSFANGDYQQSLIWILYHLHGEHIEQQALSSFFGLGNWPFLVRICFRKPLLGRYPWMQGAKMNIFWVDFIHFIALNFILCPATYPLHC